MTSIDKLWQLHLQHQADRMAQLETLRVMVLVCCDPGPWTDERREQARELTGKDGIRYIDLFNRAEAIT